MINVSKHIYDLLFDHDCVIIPNFGGFVANYASSKYDPSTNTITPPKKHLLFNKNLIETVKKIYLERKKTYSEADFKIKCESLKPALIVDKILDLYENSRD